MNDNGEKIVFHDEEVVQQQKGPVSSKAKIAFFGSLVYLLIQIVELIVGLIFVKNNENISTFIEIIDIIGIIIFFGSIILGAVALKEIKKKALSGKAFAVCGIVLPIVFFILVMIIGIAVYADDFKAGFNEGLYCASASECVNNNDGTSTCIKEDGEEIICHSDLLYSDQYK